MLGGFCHLLGGGYEKFWRFLYYVTDVLVGPLRNWYREIVISSQG